MAIKKETQYSIGPLGLAKREPKDGAVSKKTTALFLGSLVWVKGKGRMLNANKRGPKLFGPKHIKD